MADPELGNRWSETVGDGVWGKGFAPFPEKKLFKIDAFLCNIFGIFKMHLLIRGGRPLPPFESATACTTY